MPDLNVNEMQRPALPLRTIVAWSVASIVVMFAGAWASRTGWEIAEGKTVQNKPAKVARAVYLQKLLPPKDKVTVVDLDNLSPTLEEFAFMNETAAESKLKDEMRELMTGDYAKVTNWGLRIPEGAEWTIVPPEGDSLGFLVIISDN